MKGGKMSDCIFCRIINNEIPSNKVYENEHVVAFKDIDPLAAVHIVVVPKTCCLHFHKTEDNILAHIMSAIKKIVVEQDLVDKGYRLVNNNGIDGGQTVDHVHFHILGGEKLGSNLTG